MAEINWGAAKPMAQSMSAVRENGLVSFWCAALKIEGHEPALISRDGKPNEYLTREDALAAAEKFMKEFKARAEIVF